MDDMSSRTRAIGWPWASAIARACVLIAILLMLLSGQSLIGHATPLIATPAASPSPRSFIWDQVDVTVTLREDGTLHVSERVRVDFNGGPFRSGYRDIPLARIERITHIRVGAVDDGHIQPLHQAPASDFSTTTANSYTYERVGPNMRIDWSFPETTDASRTFQLDYDAEGALRVYSDQTPPYQQLSWIGVGRELTDGAPVRRASLTFVLPRPVDPGRTFVQGSGGGMPEDHTSDGQTWVWRASDLGAGDSLEAGLQFEPLVTARKPAWQDASDRQGLAAAATPAPAATPTGSDTGYSIHELPTLGGDEGVVVEVNDTGVAVGRSDLTPGDETSHATLWAGGAPVDLGTLGGPNSLAVSINDAGAIVGFADTAAGQSHAVIWRDGVIADLGTLGGETSEAYTIAADGSVVGTAAIPSGDRHAFLWRDGVMIDLGTLGGTNSEAWAIASDGRIYGIADTRDGQSHAVRWSGGVATDLGTLGGEFSAALAANANGLAVGSADGTDGVEYAVRWRDGSGAEALDPGDGTESFAASINDAGAIAGSIAGSTPEMRAVIWVDDRRTQLPGFVDGVSGAYGISGQGVIGGYATDRSDRRRPVLWTPEAAATPAALAPAAPAATPSASPAPAATPAATPVAGLTCRQAVQSDATTQTRTLSADCTTDRSLFVPDGWTFDGGGHTIYAIDPDTGSLRGGVLMVTGNAGDVRDVTIDGAGLTTSCADDNGASGLAGVLYRGASGTISGVQVQNIARTPPAAAAMGHRASCGAGIGVSGASARVFIEQNRIENAGFAAISIEAGEASISQNTIDRAYIGILTASGGRVRISPENTISSGVVGVLLEDAGTSGRIAGNTIRTMSRIGISVIDGAQAAIVDNTILGIDVNGIAIEGPRARATIEANHLDRPGGVGIKVYQGSAEIGNNDVARGQFGIIASGGATAQIVANRLTNQTDTGILISQEGTAATIADNSVQDAQSDGIWVEQDATAEITGNSVNRTARIGIAAFSGADVTITEGNEVSGGRFGISIVGAGTSATVEANAVSEVALTGYSIEGGASATLRQNRVTQTDWGILVTGEGTTAELVENRIEQTGSNGIVLGAGSHTTTSASHLRTPGSNGIWITGMGTTAVIEGSEIDDATENGIKIDDGASATIGNENHIANSNWGISVLGAGTTATITKNIIEGAAHQGIGVRVLTGAQATVRDNAISGGITGVFVQEARSAVMEQNTIRNADHAGIWFERSAPVNAGTIEIHANDIYFDPKIVTIPAETDVPIIIRGDGVVRHNFVIDALGIRVDLPPGTTKQVVINALPGTYDFYCDVPGHREAGMVGTLVVGDDASAAASAETEDAIRGNAIDGGRYGIVLKGAGAAMSVANNRVTAVERTGISIEGGAEADLTGNIVSETTTGIYVADSGTRGTLTANQITDPRERGLLIQRGAEAVLRKNVVTRAGTSGIVVGDAGTTATLEGNIVSEAAESGISVEREAQATIAKQNLVDGAKWGITILSDGTSAEVRGNRVLHVTNQGIAVLYGARATIDGNSVSGGNSGIQVKSAQTRAIVTGNFVSNAVTGVSVQEGATAERIAENNISGGGTGIVVEGAGTTAFVSGNRVRESSRYGLRFSAGAHGTVSDNEIVGARTSGVRILDATTEVEIRGNSVRDTGSNGIDISDSRVMVADNTVAGSADTGIWLGGAAAVEVTGNTIVGPGEVNQEYGPTGILALVSVHGAISGNEISRHDNARLDRTGCGIEVRNGVTDLVIAENRFPEPGNEQNICDKRAPEVATPVATPVR